MPKRVIFRRVLAGCGSESRGEIIAMAKAWEKLTDAARNDQ
jgi:hypothetical protein